MEGQGALGTFFAVALAKGGHPVTVVSSRAQTSEAVELVVEAGKRHEASLTRAPETPEGPFDLVVVATRAGEALEAARRSLAALAADGVVAPIQNGLVPLDVLDALGPDRVAPVVVGFNARAIGREGVAVTSPGGIVVGAASPAVAPQVGILGTAVRPIVPVRGTDNPRGAVTSKWCISCAINGLSLVNADSVGALTRTREGRQALLGTLSECVALAHAQDIRLERIAGPFAPDRLAGRADGGLGAVLRHTLVRALGRRYRTVVPSALAALREGRDTELTELSGRAVELGTKHEIPVLWNEAILEIGREIEAGKREPGAEAFDTLLARVGAA